MMCVKSRYKRGWWRFFDCEGSRGSTLVSFSRWRKFEDGNDDQRWYELLCVALAMSGMRSEEDTRLTNADTFSTCRKLLTFRHFDLILTRYWQYFNLILTNRPDIASILTWFWQIVNHNKILTEIRHFRQNFDNLTLSNCQTCQTGKFKENRVKDSFTWRHEKKSGKVREHYIQSNIWDEWKVWDVLLSCGKNDRSSRNTS
jgi:hypothetical protein